ncbi:hypothetical protein, partial [Scytonema sp. PRP1]|uniref:hypothetical protein n=1 Tax=Scytonema sp. PRP1 TaxID=3120513 RepID=UPI00300D07FC
AVNLTFRCQYQLCRLSQTLLVLSARWIFATTITTIGRSPSLLEWHHCSLTSPTATRGSTA